MDNARKPTNPASKSAHTIQSPYGLSVVKPPSGDARVTFVPMAKEFSVKKLGALTAGATDYAHQVSSGRAQPSCMVQLAKQRVRAGWSVSIYPQHVHAYDVETLLLNVGSGTASD
jgi:hypothetical protein